MKKSYEIHRNVKDDPFIEVPNIIYVTEFKPSSLKDFKDSFNKCLKARQEIIPISIDSPGGSVYALLGMLDIIATSPVPVATFNASKAMSCGSVLLSAGTPGFRFAAPNSTVLVHEVSSGTWGKVTDMEVDTNHGTELNKKLFGILNRNCGQSKNYFQELLLKNGNADLYFDAKAAKKHGLIDEIGYLDFRVEVVQRTTLACVK